MVFALALDGVCTRVESLLLMLLLSPLFELRYLFFDVVAAFDGVDTRSTAAGFLVSSLFILLGMVVVVVQS